MTTHPVSCSTAIPYWSCMKHRMKKQQIHFVEVPLSEESEKKAYICVSGFPDFVNEEMVKMHFENHFSSVSSVEMEGTSAIVMFAADGGEREQRERASNY